MYIKATRTHTDKAGQPVRSHRLVLAQRVGDKVRHRTLLNLGTDYPLPREKWKAVTDLAEALLYGRPPLFEGEADVQAAAEDIVAKLRARGFRADAMLEEARKPRHRHRRPRYPGAREPRAPSAASACASRPSTISASPKSSTALDIKGRDGRIASAR